MQVSFRGPTVQSMTNRLTGETHIQVPGPGLIDLNLQDPTGALLQAASWSTQVDPTTGTTVGVLALSESSRQVKMIVGWDSANDEVFVRLSGQSTKPGVRALVWGLQGFSSSGKFLLPAQAGIQFDKQSNPPNFSFAYPTHWESQFAIYESSGGGVLLYARDPKLLFKRLEGTRQSGTLDLVMWTFALGPWSSATEVPSMEWRLKTFRGSWRGAVDLYRAWSQSVLPARVPDARRDWVKRIRAVITIFETETRFLDMVAQELDPSKTLIYLVNWRAAGFDVDYPDYTAKPETTAFVQYAHGLGFHVMLHANAIGVTTSNAAYNSVAQYQLRDPETGDLLFWPWGLWPAGPPPPVFLQSYAFISPASSAYRTLFVQALQGVMQTVQPDALHLDAGGVMLNDGNGLIEGMTSIEGMIQLHRDLASTFPQVVFGYESETEALAGFHGFAQRWSSDFPSHPVSTYLMGSDVKFFGFLDQPNPGEAGFVDYVRRYEAQGVIPTITVAHDDDLNPSQPGTPPVLQVLQLWQQHDFAPDWNGDWTGQHFRYISADGRTTATVQDSGTVVSLVVGGQTIYQRVRNANSISSSSFIPQWAAYDSSTLFGLDSNREYWMNPVARPSSELRLTGLPASVKLGLGTLVAGDYGFFELENVPTSNFAFIQEFWTAKIGINLGTSTDFRPTSGAIAQVTQTLVEGKLRDPVIVMQPPFGAVLGAATFVEYEVPVPATPSVLHFSAGMSDFGTRSDGALFKVTVNGGQVWREEIRLGQWMPGQVDLTPWAGQTVKIRFLVHPGVAVNPVEDLCTWGDFNITSAPTTAPVNFKVAVPDPLQLPSATSELQLTLTPNSALHSAAASIPARFAVFAKPPQPINVGESLLDQPFVVWKRSYKGFAFPFRVQDSGTIRPVTSAGSVMNRALAVEPPDRGFSLVTWSVQLPSNASQLVFSVGLADPPAPLTSVQYSGVEFSVLINGQVVWDTQRQANGWTNFTVDLTPYRGQNVVITLQADSLGSGIFDWANWADLIIQ